MVVRGATEVTNSDQIIALSEDLSTHITRGQMYRLANPGKTPLEIIEPQSSGHLGKDDFVCFRGTLG